jgi:hypothetical protein
VTLVQISNIKTASVLPVDQIIKYSKVQCLVISSAGSIMIFSNYLYCRKRWCWNGAHFASQIFGHVDTIVHPQYILPWLTGYLCIFYIYYTCILKSQRDMYCGILWSIGKSLRRMIYWPIYFILLFHPQGIWGALLTHSSKRSHTIWRYIYRWLKFRTVLFALAWRFYVLYNFT